MAFSFCFYYLVVDKNTWRAMSLGSVTSTVFVWNNTADNDRRLCFPFIGYCCSLESRNTVILRFLVEKVFSMVVSSSNPYYTTIEHRTLRWNLCCFEWQVSQWIVCVTEWLTQWLFGFRFCIMNYLSPETKQTKKRWYLLCFLLQNKPPKTWIIPNLRFRIAIFAFYSSSIISLCRDLYTRTVYAIPS